MRPSVSYISRLINKIALMTPWTLPTDTSDTADPVDITDNTPVVLIVHILHGELMSFCTSTAH